jgi:hypothetical protein
MLWSVHHRPIEAANLSRFQIKKAKKQKQGELTPDTGCLRK